MSDNFRDSCKIQFSFSPGFSLGIRCRMKSWNRFNGFREIPVFLYKPLKRLITFRVAPNPKLKLGENEKLMDFARGHSLSNIKRQPNLFAKTGFLQHFLKARVVTQWIHVWVYFHPGRMLIFCFDCFVQHGEGFIFLAQLRKESCHKIWI